MSCFVYDFLVCIKRYTSYICSCSCCIVYHNDSSNNQHDVELNTDEIFNNIRNAGIIE